MVVMVAQTAAVAVAVETGGGLSHMLEAEPTALKYIRDDAGFGASASRWRADSVSFIEMGETDKKLGSGDARALLWTCYFFFF